MLKLTPMEQVVVKLIPYLSNANTDEKFKGKPYVHSVYSGFNDHVRALMAKDRGCQPEDVAKEDLYELLRNMVERKVIGAIACKGGPRYFLWADFEKAQAKQKKHSKEDRAKKIESSLDSFLAGLS